MGNLEYYGGNIPFIRSGEIHGDTTEIYITKKGLDNSSAKLVNKGDILYALYGATSGEVDISKIEGAINQAILAIIPNKNNNNFFIMNYLKKEKGKIIATFLQGGQGNLSAEIVKNIDLKIPNINEQNRIGELFKQLDNLITLHQSNSKRRVIMKNILKRNELFYKYYQKWISIYKDGAIRKVTMKKYLLTLKWLKFLAPTLTFSNLNRINYQNLLNEYAKTHEKQSTLDFHHQLKAAIIDAVDDGLIEKDPTRKAIIKGKTPRIKKIKYLNQFELQKLIQDLKLEKHINYDWLILLIAKTGIRFSEALAITPKDFDFPHQLLNINKTWNYKEKGGFLPTKNESSNRKIQLDWQTIIQFSELVKNLEENKPIFVDKPIYNSTINDILSKHCKNASIPVISIHGLRHTHASLLLYAGVSIASVANRLGHSSMTTTQKTYLHIIQELENTDIDIIMRTLTNLNK